MKSTGSFALTKAINIKVLGIKNIKVEISCYYKIIINFDKGTKKGNSYNFHFGLFTWGMIATADRNLNNGTVAMLRSSR